MVGSLGVVLLIAVALAIYLIFFGNNARTLLKDVFESYGPFDRIMCDSDKNGEYRAVMERENINRIMDLYTENISALHANADKNWEPESKVFYNEIKFESEDGLRNVSIYEVGINPTSYAIVHLYDGEKQTNESITFKTYGPITEKVMAILNAGERILVQDEQYEMERFRKLTLGEKASVSMSIKQESLDGNGCTVVVNNEDNEGIEIGNTYHFEEWKDGQWNRYSSPKNLLYLPVWYKIEPNGEQEFIIDWRKYVGNLPSGRFRLVKKYLQNGMEYWVKCEFNI